jgi:hypothetical protein
MNQLNFVIAALCLIATVTRVDAIICYTGAEYMRTAGQCSGTNTNYCYKYSTNNLIGRDCDTNGAICTPIGLTCNNAFPYDGATGTMCCCNTNYCNSANVSQSASQLMMMMIVGIVAIMMIKVQ